MKNIKLILTGITLTTFMIFTTSPAHAAQSYKKSCVQKNDSAKKTCTYVAKGNKKYTTQKSDKPKESKDVLEAFIVLALLSR